MIPVTKPYLPSREKLDAYIDGVYERRWLTNNGPLLQQLTQRLEEYLGVENLLLVSNGTLALQVAYKVLGISNSGFNETVEAITTPFTFVATASSLQWEGVKPVFVDIAADSWCLDPANIEAAITDRTRAIVPVHVFGNASEVEAIGAIAQKHQLKVVYDASHAFAVKYKGSSLLNWGDAATLSFHATKLFHTIEGGAIVFKHKADLECAKQMINFGLSGPEDIAGQGINAKMNEFQAAMGLCVLDEMAENLAVRKAIVKQYQQQLPPELQRQAINDAASVSYAYMPVALKNEEQVLTLLENLKQKGIVARRYFYPSLNCTEYGDGQAMPVSEEIAQRIVCLPLHVDLSESDINQISNIIRKVV